MLGLMRRGDLSVSYLRKCNITYTATIHFITETRASGAWTALCLMVHCIHYCETSLCHAYRDGRQSQVEKKK